MSPHSEPDPTIAYYEEHADRFIAETRHVDMGDLYAPFLALIPPGGRILDAGCGSGRDARAFLDLGYDVEAVDASPAMAIAASRVIGREVRVLRLQDLDYEGEFDGVWACASLLHVQRTQLKSVFQRSARALRPQGILYASFKVSPSHRTVDGRVFIDFEPDSFREFAARLAEFRIERLWMTGDRRPGRSGEEWVNTLLRNCGHEDMGGSPG